MVKAEDSALHYQQRLVAFVDVLGFADLVIASGKDARALARVGKLVATNRLFEAFFTKLMQRATATFFSDSFVVSVGPDEIIYLVREIGYLCRYLLLLGLPCRGGISCGDLYHAEKIVVGPALIKAYLLEQEAEFPRVLLDKSAMEKWRAEFDGEPAHADCVSLVKTDDVGGNYLDIFDPGWSTNFLPWTEFIPSPDAIPSNEKDYIEAVQERIREGRAAASTARTRAKYDWLAQQCRS